MSYQQLIEERRYQIFTLLELGISITEIPKTVKCHRAKVYREIKRNQTHGQYCPMNAHTYSISRRKIARKYRIPAKHIEFVRFLLGIDSSPEQIYNVLISVRVCVSHQWVARDNRQGGKFYRHHLRAKKSILFGYESAFQIGGCSDKGDNRDAHAI